MPNYLVHLWSEDGTREAKCVVDAPDRTHAGVTARNAYPGEWKVTTVTDYNEPVDDETTSRVQRLVARHNEARNGKLTFTVEAGRGATYSDGDPTIYAHWTYERSSVLAGQSCRQFIQSFDSFLKAMNVLATAGVKFDVLDGTTYIDINSRVAHLPEGDC